jgi:hypothetical protein
MDHCSQDGLCICSVAVRPEKYQQAFAGQSLAMRSKIIEERSVLAAQTVYGLTV